jgi:hypothetical protein
MRTPKGKGALLHAPIPLTSVRSLPVLSPRVKRFPAKFARNRFKATHSARQNFAHGLLDLALAGFKQTSRLSHGS